METRTKLNRIRIAPRKVRAVADVIKKKDVENALDQLEHIIRKPAPVILKALKSAIANAEKNFKMVKDNLYIKNILVDEGTKLRRFMPRARGRTAEIQKKTSRVTIILDERVPGLKQKAETKKVKKEEKQEYHKDAGQDELSSLDHVAKPEVKKEIGQKHSIFRNIGRRIFRRKAT